MTIQRVACVEVTSVPEMIFEAQKYNWGIYNCFHIGDTCREGMPEHAYCKVVHSLRDKVHCMRFI